MAKRLVVAEKPSVGRAIADVLLQGDEEKHEGYIEGRSWIVTWCVGHLVENAAPEDYDERYRKWRMEDLPIVPKGWKLNPIEESSGQLNTIRMLAQRTDVCELVEATDAGREGELIFRLVMRYIGCSKPFRRLWVSSLEPKALAEGFENLKPSSKYDSLYAAALARSRADWLYGMNGTRYYTLLSSERGAKSVGRVQTPTLAMVVKRQEEIENFKVTKRWAVEKDFDGWTLCTDNFLVRKEAEECAKTTDGQDVLITSVTHEKRKGNPPLLHSLSTLQQEANRRFGMTAKETLDVMQALYDRRVLTYPRTDSNYITTDMKHTMERIVSNLSRVLASRLPDFKSTGVDRLIADDKVTDHHAVLITEDFSKRPDARNFTESERRIVRLVEIRILETVSPAFAYEETEVEGDCCGYAFSGFGRTVEDEGWRGVAKALLDLKESEGNVFPSDIEKGRKYASKTTQIVDRDTVPPRFYTDETLLSAMERAGAKDMDKEVERKGLGTSATRAETIEKLIRRNYITRKKKYLKATQSGRDLIARVDAGFKDVGTTVDWENRLLAMERGEGESMQQFCSSVEARIRELLENGPKETAQKHGRIVGRCPLCGNDVETFYTDLKCKGCGMKMYLTHLGDDGGRTRLFTPNQASSMLAGKEVSAKRTSRNGKPYEEIVSIDLDASRKNMENGKRNFVLKRRFKDKRKGKALS